MALSLEEAYSYGERLHELIKTIGHYRNGVPFATLLKKLGWDSYKLQALLQIAIASQLITLEVRGGLHHYSVKPEFKVWSSEFEEIFPKK